MTLGVLEDHLVIQQCLHPQCDDSGHYSRKHPVMPFSQQAFYFWVLEPKIHSTYLVLIVFARSFRILVTLRQSSRSVVFLSSKYHEPLRQKFFEPKYHNQSTLEEFSIHNCDSASSTFLHGLSGRNMLNSFDILIYASTTQKVICSFELSPFSYIPTFIYQLIVKSM